MRLTYPPMLMADAAASGDGAVGTAHRGGRYIGARSRCQPLGGPYLPPMPRARNVLPEDRDPVVEAYKAGVDRTLLRRNLRKTPTERLEDLMALQRLAEEARRAGERLRE